LHLDIFAASINAMGETHTHTHTHIYTQLFKLYDMFQKRFVCYVNECCLSVI